MPRRVLGKIGDVYPVCGHHAALRAPTTSGPRYSYPTNQGRDDNVAQAVRRAAQVPHVHDGLGRWILRQTYIPKLAVYVILALSN